LYCHGLFKNLILEELNKGDKWDVLLLHNGFVAKENPPKEIPRDPIIILDYKNNNKNEGLNSHGTAGFMTHEEISKKSPLKQKWKKLVPKHDYEKDPNLEDIESSVVRGVRSNKPSV